MPHCEDTINSLHTIRDFLRWSVSQFNANNLWFGHGTDNAWDEAVQLIMVSLNLPPEGEERLLDARLTDEEKRHLYNLVIERIDTRKPVPYLTGKSWFAGLMFHVDERVLIPRSPIAELIEHGFHPWLSYDPQRILDLCTGSGCIGIACAYAFPEADVMLSDISSDALAVAGDNIRLHNLENRVFSVKSDLFSGVSEEQFDLIVTNPPYVDERDMSSMPAEYQHEPELALASGDDGLDFTRRLLREAAGYLTENGVLIVEVGNSWVALEKAFPEMPFTWIEFERGGHGVFLLHRQDLLEFTNRL